MTDDTRDIAIETRAELRSMRGEIRDFMEESKKHREAIMGRLESHEAIVNKGKGAWWGVGALGILGGWIGSHFPGLSHLLK